MKLVLIIALLIFQIIAGLAHAVTWQEDVESWRDARVNSLTRPHGWLSLVEMAWLHNGENTIGSAEDNDIVLPHGPEYVGKFVMVANKINFTPFKDVSIKVNDETINSSIIVNMDTQENTSVFTLDSFLFYVIERGKPALRIKDSSAQAIQSFSGIDYFPLNEEFLIEAQFIPYDPVKEIEIINVLGLLNKETALGRLVFEIKGNTYSLDAMDADDELYVIFADKTSGRTSYGPGRFLYVPKAGDTNKTIINFHKAYNPPCAFSDYSTCPLPPPQNRLPVFIEAGEKKYTQ
ncbi:MAG: DUF1684 domain-containing protein [Marinicellaceae bacterium]